ncbi:amino acid permease [Candidatus Thorarchaeota archaeon]|nr:MAG: amino acid permease [Candidatus Thorarchaeota archaeon]
MSVIEEKVFNRDIGVFGLTMLGVGATIGAGVFVLLGDATAITGPSVIIAFIFNFFLALAIAMHYGEMAAMFPVEGGGFSFVEEAFGGSAYYVGWLIWMGNMAYASFSASAFALYMTSGTIIPALPVAVITFLIFTAVNFSGITRVVKVEKLVTALLIGMLVIFIFRGAIITDVSTYQNMFPNGVLALLPATSLVFLCYIGFETITTISAEVKEPKITIPKALIGAVIISGILYTSFAFVFAGAVSVGDISNPETALLQFFATDIMRELLLFAAALATLSTLNIALMAASRNAYALARDSFLPKTFSKVSKKDVPINAIILTAVICLVLILSEGATAIAELSNFAYMLVVSMVCLSVLALRKRCADRERAYAVPLFPYITYFGIITPLILIPFLGTHALLIGAGWLIIGFLFYNIWRSQAFRESWNNHIGNIDPRLRCEE